MLIVFYPNFFVIRNETQKKFTQLQPELRGNFLLVDSISTRKRILRIFRPRSRAGKIISNTVLYQRGYWCFGFSQKSTFNMPPRSWIIPMNPAIIKKPRRIKVPPFISNPITSKKAHMSPAAAIKFIAFSFELSTRANQA